MQEALLDCLDRQKVHHRYKSKTQAHPLASLTEGGLHPGVGKLRPLQNPKHAHRRIAGRHAHFKTWPTSQPADLVRTSGVPFGYGSKLNHQGTAGLSPCFHLPGFHFGYLFLTHSHFRRGFQPKGRGWLQGVNQFQPKKAVC